MICSKNIPSETKRLVDLLKKSIISGQFDVFSGELYSQKGRIQENPNRSLTPDEIIKMDWLAENVIGSIPKTDELKEQAKPVTRQQGVKKEKGQI